MTDILERGAVVSGIGISRIGRKLDVPGVDLTAEAATEAIADAGLSPADIDGIATMGETPIADAAFRLGIEHAWTGQPFGRWGLLSPVVNAFHAVATGEARHVLVYRTVNMVGGSVFPPPGRNEPATQAPKNPAPVSERENPMADIPRLLAAHAYSAANWIALHARRHMHLYGTTKEQLGWLAVNSRDERGPQPARGVPSPDHHGRLPCRLA